MSNNYVPPDSDLDAYNCPHCGAFSEQQEGSLNYHRVTINESQIRKCARCDSYTIWIGESLIYPRHTTAPPAHNEMPDDVQRDFEEARLVVSDSPRAAAALLRLAIQRLVEEHLDAEGRDLYHKIGDLVESGKISPRIQRALDSVRVIGNESVHPGEMEMDDDRETANALFGLVNEIVDETLGRDQRIDGIFDNLPEGARDGIEQRDDE